MIAPGVPLDEITESHLRAAIASGIRESRTVDFKRELPGTNDAAKLEFLRDASSFANGGGGELIFGIAETNGVASEITAIACDSDSEMLRLSGVLQAGIEPRLVGVQMHPIRIGDAFAFVVRIPASWTRPHAIKSAKNTGSYRFYSRNSAGKYPLDISEIRSAFLDADTALSRVRQWQTGRLGQIVAGDTPVRLVDTPTLVMHCIPLSPQTQVTPAALAERGILRPIASSYSEQDRWTIDGFLASTFEPTRKLATGYALLFLDGHYESTNAQLIERARLSGETSVLNGFLLEQVLRDGPADALRALQIAGVTPPFAILFALTGVRGFEIRNPRGFAGSQPSPIDRDLLLLPEVLCESYEWNRVEEMRVAIDALWRAAGSLGSPSYRSDGTWIAE